VAAGGRVNQKGERALFNGWDAPTLVSLTTTSARTAAALSKGNYIITCESDCTYIQGASDCAATANSRRLWAKSYVRIDIPSDTTKQYIAAILASGTATLSIERIDQD
jgi:hypothetical protein